MNVRRSIATAAAVLGMSALSLGLTSCGFDAPTDMVYDPAAGVSDQEGTVDALNAAVVSAADGSGTLVVSFANNDQEDDDSLVGVSGEGVQVGLGGDTAIPAGGLLTRDDAELSVTGEAVEPGEFVTLTFTFDRAQSVTMDVPVVAAEGEFADVPTS